MRIFAMVTTNASTQYTRVALNSFFHTTPLRSQDLFILIDNDNDYTIPQSLQDKQIDHIKNATPKSFAENANVAISKALANKADLFFLNNDVVFTKDWLNPLLLEEARIITPLSNRELQYHSKHFTTSSHMDLSSYLQVPEALEKINHYHRNNNSGYLQVLGLPFFTVKLPYRIMSAVGFFDEAYGLGGGEDFDYCVRAYLEGFSVCYACQSFVLHFGGKSTWSGVETRIELRRREYGIKNHFALKWGKTLQNIMIEENHEAITSCKKLHQLINDNQHRKVLESLLHIETTDSI